MIVYCFKFNVEVLNVYPYKGSVTVLIIYLVKYFDSQYLSPEFYK